MSTLKGIEENTEDYGALVQIKKNGAFNSGDNVFPLPVFLEQV